MSAGYKPNMKLFEKQRDPDLRADYSPGIGREAKSNKFADAKQGDATKDRLGYLTVLVSIRTIRAQSAIPRATRVPRGKIRAE
jgi:hypothetical protein